ncbi:MAG: carbohydrate binding family 9 domain-containing protein [Bacteroidetes bacterium]|nr:carbohydrate binding family 9 domain-containing protein [Bacteroidota bacterium]
MILLKFHCALGTPLSIEDGSAAADSSRKAVIAVRCDAQAPVIDGSLSDAIWQTLPVASDFLQKDPSEGKPASLRTEVRFCYDDDALYIGATMYVDDPSEIQSTLSRRDNAGNSERLLVSIDSYDDNRTAYTFGVTADGVRIDYYHASDYEHSRDYSFDPVWEARVARTSTAWTAEMRIPFSQLRFNNKDVQRWGLNMNRYIPFRDEDVYWVLIPKNETGWSSRFGTLTGIHGIQPSSRIELTPYSVADFTVSRTGNPVDPFYNKIDWRGNVGIDMKMGLGPNLTLDATVNPDFGQVEADPAEVNLSAYETYYTERRPFFIEGSQLLSGEGPDYFYTRRIGAPPSLSPNASFSERPINTTILGAAKLSGRLASGLSIAALTALTQREYVETFDRVSNKYSEALVEPLAGYGVMRIQQEFGEETSTIGAMITGVQRDLNSPAAEQLLTRQATSGGLDWKLRFDRATYELSGYAGFSYITGSADAVALVQQSSAHYFQRQDADYIDFDPTRTSLAGYTTGLHLVKQSGEHWIWGVGASAESPGFEINDAGILRSADDIDTWGELAYRENTPGDLFHNYEVEVSATNGWNFGLVRQYSSIGLGLQAMWKNYYSSSISFDYGTAALNDHLTRGGPLMRSGDGWNLYANITSSYSEDVRWNLWASRFGDALGSWNWSAGSWISVRTKGWLEFSVEPSYLRNVNARQYVMTADNGPEDTFGQRYIFATVDQATLAARFRFNFAFSPDLTLELYAEPFAASGAFSGFGELPAAESDQLRIYGQDPESSISYDTESAMYDFRTERGNVQLLNPDFNILSFRSNVVLRWEWVRGSTLFLVWQQNRSGYDIDGNQVGPRDLLRSFDSPGDNFIALKISYWIPVT